MELHILVHYARGECFFAIVSNKQTDTFSEDVCRNKIHDIPRLQTFFTEESDVKNNDVSINSGFFVVLYLMSFSSQKNI